MYSVEELSINGYEIAFFYADSVYGGNCYISFMSIIPELLEEKTLLKLKLLKSGLEYLISITKMISIIQMISSF